MSDQSMVRTGIGFDMHRLVKDRELVLGGVTIQHKLGLEGHSDADVVTHAVIDALLGAAAEGSIGLMFPNTDPRWKGARSLDLLAAVMKRLAVRRARVLNVDATVIAQQPRLAPHFEAMRLNLADVLGVPVDQVSVKATTAEHMGVVGREEGMAAMAVATIEMAG